MRHVGTVPLQGGYTCFLMLYFYRVLLLFFFHRCISIDIYLSCILFYIFIDFLLRIFIIDKNTDILLSKYIHRYIFIVYFNIDVLLKVYPKYPKIMLIQNYVNYLKEIINTGHNVL